MIATREAMIAEADTGIDLQFHGVSVVSLARAYLPISIEILDDFPFRARYWFADEWAAEIDRLRGVRRALDRQPIASIKAAATRAIHRAERVTQFPHFTYELILRWYDLDDEGRPMELPE